MLLAVDIGNTHTVFGIFGDDGELINHWRISSDPNKTSYEYLIVFERIFEIYKIDKSKIIGAIISSVVPQLGKSISSCINKLMNIKPLELTDELNLGLEIKYKNPAEVGADRIANAVAVKKLFKTPAIVVDFGTAITFDILSKEGDYLGGMIMPGFNISAEALHHQTAKLPQVQVKKPSELIGKDTITSIQSGMYYGFIGAVEGNIQRIKKELNFGECDIIATGGLAGIMSEDTNIFTSIEPFLTLYGLKYLWELNS